MPGGALASASKESSIVLESAPGRSPGTGLKSTLGTSFGRPL